MQLSVYGVGQGLDCAAGFVVSVFLVLVLPTWPPRWSGPRKDFLFPYFGQRFAFCLKDMLRQRDSEAGTEAGAEAGP